MMFFVFPQGDTVYETVVPEVDETELEKMVNPIVQEYFEHGDTKEVQVKDLKCIPAGVVLESNNVTRSFCQNSELIQDKLEVV